MKLKKVDIFNKLYDAAVSVINFFNGSGDPANVKIENDAESPAFTKDVDLLTAFQAGLNIVDKSEAIVLHNAATAAEDGTVIDVSEASTVYIEIYGTSTSKTVLFQAAGQSGIFQAIKGAKNSCLDPENVTYATQSTTDTHTTSEWWEFDVSAFEEFKARLDSIGNGNCSIKGRME